MSSSSSSSPIVLITGITGFLASHVLHDVLADASNFRVRGTLRSAAKKQAVLDTLKEEDRQRVEFVEVKDTGSSDLSEAVKDVTYIAHVASPYQLNVEDAERDLLKPAIEGTLNILRYAKKEPSVKRIAITSSFAAVTNFKAGGPNRPGFTYTAEDWNPTTYEEAVAFGGAGAFAYSASKKLADKAAWTFLEEEKPSFEIGTFCPPMIYGPTLQPGVKRSNLNTSSATIYNLINHAKEMPDDRLPLFCDARDVAAAHRSYFTSKNPGNTRFLLCSPDAYNWGTAVGFIAREYPQLKDRLPQGWEEGAKNAKDPKTSYAKLDTSPAKEKLGVTFRGFEETLRDSIDSLLELEKQPGFNQ